MRYENIINLIEKPISGEWGKEPHEGDQEVIKVIRTTNFTNIGRLDLQDVVLRKIGHEKVEKKRLLYGDIIIEKSGGSPNQPVGRVVYFDIKNDVYLCNNFTSILRPKKSIVSKYLFYALFYKHITKRTLKYQNKTTGIINLQLQRYLEIEKIPLPPIETQKKIADVLDKAQELIDKRKEQIEKLDEFIQSVFLDMFGDPIRNSKNWVKDDFGNYIEVLTDYHANGSYKILKQNVELLDEENYALMIRTTDLENNNFTKNVKYITKEAYEFLSKTKVYGGEIIINKIGSAGNVYLMPKLNRPVSLGMNLFMIRLSKKLNNVFIYHLFNNSTGKSLIMSKVRGAVTKTITKDAIRQINIPIPPIELQNKFAEIVEKTEKQKELLQKSLTEMENNFNCLMQKAFRGELF